MTGKYDIVVQNRRLQYKFTIERNHAYLNPKEQAAIVSMMPEMLF